MESEFAKWALDFERRAADVFQRAIDKMPKPKDGTDGLDVDDMAVEHDGDGNVTFKWLRDGVVVKLFALRLPRFKDCGVYREATYREGDGVTWAGSFWLAQKDGELGKPGLPDSGWRLAVKAGRDGKSPEPEREKGPVKLR